MGLPSMPNLPWEELRDVPDRQSVPLTKQRIAAMGPHKSLQSMQRLPTNHHCATRLCSRRFEHMQDGLWRIDSVHNLRLHGVHRNVSFVKHAYHVVPHLDLASAFVPSSAEVPAMPCATALDGIEAPEPAWTRRAP